MVVIGEWSVIKHLYKPMNFTFLIYFSYIECDLNSDLLVVDVNYIKWRVMLIWTDLLLLLACLLFLQDQFAKWMVVICSVNIFCRRMNHQPNILLHDNAQCVIFAHFNFFWQSVNFNKDNLLCGLFCRLTLFLLFSFSLFGCVAVTLLFQ